MFSFLNFLSYNRSPERITGQQYSFKSDVWGLGLTILAVALGMYPYTTAQTENGFWGLLTAIQEEPPPDAPSDIFSEVRTSHRINY